MNWQETVMTKEQVNQELGDEMGYGIEDWIKGLLEVQAKATWEAHQKEIDEAEQRGRNQIIDWVNKQKVFGDRQREGNGYIERQE